MVKTHLVKELISFGLSQEFLGAEHQLTRYDLRGIRRIELELHGTPASETEFLDMLSHDFKYVYTCIYSSVFTGSLGIVHATRKGVT